MFQDIPTSGELEGCALLAEKAGRLALSVRVLHEAIQVEATMPVMLSSHLRLVHYSQDNNLFFVQDAEAAERDIRINDKQTLRPNQVARERFGK